MAAIGSFVSLAPVVLGLHWGLELDTARARLREAREREEAEYLACLRGEGCPIAYEEYKWEAQNAALSVEMAKDFRLAGATRALVLPMLRPGAPRRRSAPATMGPEDDSSDDTASASLEEKMSKWEASEAEQRATTLGGNLPLVGMPGLPGRMTRTDQPEKLDGFDVGMNISGLILFPLALLLFSVPFCIGSIDVSSVGPPPTS